MAKRKRLTPTSFDQGEDPHRSSGMPRPDLTSTVPDMATPLRPSLTQSAMRAPPIAQVAGNAAIQAALDEVTEAMARARSEGRLVLALPLAALDMDHLVRDRIGLDEAELHHLMDSIREHGQRTPIEVTDLGEERTVARYGLISGWRRVQALQRLAKETGEARFASVLALLRRPTEASEAYVAMVEENEIRQGLSYYERARIVARSVDLGVFETEKKALQRLFSAASRARRSKIGSFLTLVRGLDEVLCFPAAIPERLGLALAKALEARPEEAIALTAALKADPAPDTAVELARLGAFVLEKSGSYNSRKGRSSREIRPGVFLGVTGGFTKPVLTLSGPAVDPAFRDRLEDWLRSGK